jgi:RNA polymerase sigma-70 factor, ECF subfamily
MDQPQSEHDRFLLHFLPVRGMIRAFLHAATRNVHETDDLCQQVGGVLWRKFVNYDPSRPFAAWAVGIARMELLKWRDRSMRGWRQRSLSDEAILALADAAGQPERESEQVPEEQSAALRRCMERLTPRAREAMERKYRDGQSIRAIADAQGREVGAIEMTLVRARRALRDCIEQRLAAAPASETLGAASVAKRTV